jgi:plastocyanin
MLLAAGCGSSSTPPTASKSEAPSQTPTAAAGAAKSAVTIAGFAYAPTPVTVSPGEKVDVTNTDSAEHTITSDMAGLFLADDVKTGMHVTFTAPSKAGTYTYHCQYHPNMHGTLVVKG